MAAMRIYLARMAEERMQRKLKAEQERNAKGKDSDAITKERVDLLKTIKNEQDKLLVFGYIHIEAFKTYNIYIPASIVEYIILYIWYLPELERARKRIKEIRERRERRKIEAKYKEIDDRVKLLMQPLIEQVFDLRQKLHKLEGLISGATDNHNENIESVSNSFDDNDNVAGVTLWLRDTVKLGEYLDLFIKNGIDRLSVVVLLDKRALREIGVDKIGHRLLILSEIEKLKRL